MSIRQRLYLNSGNEELLLKHCADVRFVYNFGLEQRTLWHRESTQKITYVTQATEPAELRAGRSWLAESWFVIQQAAPMDLDQAFRNRRCNPKHFSQTTWRKAGQKDSLPKGWQKLAHFMGAKVGSG